ncbi:molecular chaperone [Litorivivens sp.]|uniref:fimbrial biogenesis chaperone n=1 Tax=Litorivivens sp. TaxID=2020868 RepID=UPI0035632AE4
MHLKNIPLYLLLCSLTMLSAPPLNAEITLDQSVIDVIAGSTRRADFHVYNRGDSTQSVQIEVYKVLFPGQPEEQRVTLSNPREMGMIATPRQFDVEPQGRRKVRLSFLGIPEDTDAIYRVVVKPRQIATPKDDQKAPIVSIVFNYEVLAVYRPPSPVSALEFSHTNNGLTFTNTGNSNFLLYVGRECRSKQAPDCKVLPTKRIYAGASHTYMIDDDTRHVSFLVKDHQEPRAITLCGNPLTYCD